MSMTPRERADLTRLVKERAKIAKLDADQVAAERLADFEQQAASIYAAEDDQVWAEQKRMVSQVVAEANKRIAQRSRELGVPDWTAPRISNVGWSYRGQNACEERVKELRKVAKTRFDADAQRAKVDIERASIDVQTELVADGLETAVAQLFLANMPTAEKLMPTYTITEIETAIQPFGDNGPVHTLAWKQRMLEAVYDDQEDDDQEDDETEDPPAEFRIVRE